MSVNLSKLQSELEAAGVPATCNELGAIFMQPGATPAQFQKAGEILAAHDPAPTPDQSLRARLAAKGLDPDTAALLLVVQYGASAPAIAKTRVQNRANAILAAWNGT